MGVVLLMLFALVAGAGTALSPCVLPVLPAVLSAGVTGGRRRPLGVVVGLAASFTFATVALVYVIDALGLPDDLLRTLAITTLFAFGVLLLVPALTARVEAWVSGLVPGPARGGGDGFGSGVVLGASLGLVYAPCAVPILAGVITVSAAQDFTAGKLAVALSYAIGSVAVLYAFMVGGRRLADRLSAHRGRIQIAMGAVMVAVAVAMVADLDLKFQNAIADDLPAVLVNPTADLEESDALADELAAVQSNPHAAVEGGVEEAAAGIELPDLGLAPELAAGNWLNTPAGEPLTLAELDSQNRVVLIDFWTYTCINCIRTLPYIRAWDSEYREKGLTVIGVHTPEFAFEKETGNVAGAIDEYDLAYPVVQDNERGTWDAFGNQYWPAKYLIDADGHVRYTHFGEGSYEETEAAIRSLLAEAGGAKLGKGVGHKNAETADPALRTPETYLGWERAQGFAQPPRPGRGAYTAPPGPLPVNGFALDGIWEVDGESATAVEAGSIRLGFQARRVFLVMGSEGAPGEVEVLLDGERIPADFAGEDVRGGSATVTGQRLYRLVDLPDAGEHSLELRLEPGVSGYAFTFG
jgi:cytochrome c biogenesis protein CcdA/thiol-disulfide isomerase/thioredoxin